LAYFTRACIALRTGRIKDAASKFYQMKRLFTLLLFCLGWAHMITGQCEIHDLVVEQLACENGHFNAQVNFIVVNPAGELFGVMGNGTNYGTFGYGSLPITLGPLEGDGTTEWEFNVFDVNNTECHAVYILGTVSCCAINEVVVDPTECINQEIFNAFVNFNHVGTGGVGFDVFNANGGSLGFFHYEDLPVLVTGIPSVIGNTHITICDNDNPDCCATAEFESLNCNPSNCEISNVDVLVSDCENGQFFVTIGFNYMNVSEHFVVTGNGNNYGTFTYSSLPITLGPFAGNGETVYEFVITDAETPGCHDFAVVSPVTCPLACGFHDVVVDPLHCQGDGFYSFLLNFIPIETGDNFSVFSQGEFLGSYSYGDLPVVVDSFPASCNNIDVFTICDNADTTCCETFEFEAMLCCEDCIIYDLVAEHTVCDSNDQFYVVLNFQYQNVGSSGFTVAGNGNVYGQFNYPDLPVTLGPFDGDGTTHYEFVVTDNEDGFCFDEVNLGIINCTCSFDSISVDPIECTGNGTFSLLLDFVPAGVSNDFFDVYAGNEFIGYYAYADLPVVIEHFPDNPGGPSVMLICDNDNPSCCVAYTFIGLNCTCEIYDLVADAFECDTATNTFALYIDFEWTGNDQFFDVFKGNALIGTVEGANLPDTLYGLTDDGGGALITVCGHEHPDCCAHVEISVPQCGEEPCHIFELVAEAFECDTSTNTFALYIDFAWTGSDQFFDVFKGNHLIGTVEGANLPDTLYGLTDDGGGALITVCGHEHHDCCAHVEIAVPECGQDCEIYDVVVGVGECTGDSTFAIAVTYHYTGFTNEFVELWTGDNYLGLYNINVQPIVIQEFPWNGHEVMPLRICQNDNPDCCRTVEFHVPSCLFMEECGIFEIVVDPIGCVTDSTFAAWVSFDAVGFSGPVQIWAGDTYLGVFPQTTPLLLTNIPEHSGGILLTICQAENADCCGHKEFQGLVCEHVCSISDLTATISDCEAGTFNVTLDFEFDNEGIGFAVLGNDSLYGFFSYSQVPLTLGPLPGDNSTEWEFVVVDLSNPICLDYVYLGVVDCPTGIISISPNTLPLEIYYGEDGAHFVIPEDATEFSLWTFGGQQVAAGNDVASGDRVRVSTFISVPGLYIVQVRSDENVYVGKVIVF